MKTETLSEQLYFTTVHIESKDETGCAAQGTGFIVNFGNGLFVVTAKHVVENAISGSIKFHIANNDKPSLSKGKKVNISDFKQYWIRHPDPDMDIAVMSMSVLLEDARRCGQTYYFKSIPMDIFATNEKLQELDAFEEIVFLGYPSGIYDEVHYLPVFRRGVTASPIYVNHNGKQKFLVDGAVFSGSSGSPVFVYNKGSYSKRTGGLVVGDRLIFVGVLAEGYRDSQGKLPSPTRSEMPSLIDGQTINLGVVYKSTAICEVMERLRA